MKILFLLLIIPFNIACSQQVDYKSYSEEIFTNIRNLEYAKVTALFDSALSRRVDSTRLRKNWESVLVLAGPYIKTIDIKEEQNEIGDIVTLEFQFEKRKMNLKFIFNTKNNKIKAFSFLSGEVHELYKLPDYDNPALYTEKELAIQNTIYRLPGILTTPKKPGRFPVVIMVHGSGANDKDETVGPMKIFKDLAIGLATKGVAVYRYEKRTRVYRGRMMRKVLLTVNEETIDDAVAAVKLLKSDSTVDSTAIYVCGHSFGGMLLPRIAARAPEIKGLIYLCPNGRPLEDMIYEQASYTITFDTTGKDRTAYLDSVKKETQKIKKLNNTDSDSLYILGIPVCYWKDLNTYNPIKSAQSLNTHMFFLQGGRDYQVTETDYNIWKNGLQHKKATFKLYPDLSHFFIKGVGKSVPAEYNKVGNVDISVIDDISKWILSDKK